jgi:hypothetical protein
VSCKKSTTTSKCASVAGHFDGHAEALKQYMWHCPMTDVQGYFESHWTLSSGDYSLHDIAQRTPGSQAKQRQWENTLFAGHFNGHGNALVRYHVHHLIEVAQS